MTRASRVTTAPALLLALFAIAVVSAEPPTATSAPAPAVATLLEENAEALLPLLTNPTGDPGQGFVERAEVFSGKSGVRIVPMQRFSPKIPAWDYRIVETPQAPNEYRFVRFAWKAGDGCVGTMVQLHIETGWSVRYVAGQNDPGWGAKSVAAKPPAEWTVVTRDLFADFGRCTVTGIALVAFRGQGGYFDHVYFGRTLDDLDRIDATGLRDGPPTKLEPAQLERLWTELSSEDDRKAYLAFWTLVADPERSRPYLKAKLADAGADADEAKLRQWVRELDDEDFRVRERAQARLARNSFAAAPLLREALDANPSPELRLRLEELLKPRDGAVERRSDAIEQARRILDYCK